MHKVGIGTLTSNILNLRWKLLILFLVYPFIFACNTWGWAYAFPTPLPKHVRFKDLYFVRIIGETFNNLIPWAASLGGEPIKAQLLKKNHEIPLSASYASLLIVHVTFWISLNLFVILGLLITSKSRPLTPVLWHSMLIFLVVLGGVVFVFTLLLFRGVFSKTHGLVKKIGWIKKLEDKTAHYLKLDGEIKDFFLKNPKRLLLSSFFNFLSWFLGSFEVYFFGKILGLPISFTDAWLLESLIQVLRIITFFVPASIGAQEGGILYIFSEFGFSNPLSITFAILRRIREIIWVALGLILWAIMDHPVPKQ